MTADKPTELSYNPHIPLSQALLLPRIVIENTMPTLDGGQFAVKAVIDQDVVVTSKVFADGHDKLAVRIRWRADGDDTWQSEVMAELGNNGWQGQFRVKKQGRYVFCLEAWIDQYASFCYELEKNTPLAFRSAWNCRKGALTSNRPPNVPKATSVNNWRRCIINCPVCSKPSRSLCFCTSVART